jgi:hypothetical protein
MILNIIRICNIIRNLVNYSWFQTFAMFWILYVFFWVFPWHQIVISRRFGTLCQFHLQRLCVEYTSPSILTYPLWPPNTWFLPPLLVLPSRSYSWPGREYHALFSPPTQYSTRSLWRWNWQKVPKRQQITIWRRGNTQKNTHNIVNCIC